jgi:hypothetical protein
VSLSFFGFGDYANIAFNSVHMIMGITEKAPNSVSIQGQPPWLPEINV